MERLLTTNDSALVGMGAAKAFSIPVYSNLVSGPKLLLGSYGLQVLSLLQDKRIGSICLKCT